LRWGASPSAGNNRHTILMKVNRKFVKLVNQERAIKILLETGKQKQNFNLLKVVATVSEMFVYMLCKVLQEFLTTLLGDSQKWCKD
jgi:hypothetical protein